MESTSDAVLQIYSVEPYLFKFRKCKLRSIVETPFERIVKMTFKPLNDDLSYTTFQELSRTRATSCCIALEYPPNQKRLTK